MTSPIRPARALPAVTLGLHAGRPRQEQHGRCRAHPGDDRHLRRHRRLRDVGWRGTGIEGEISLNLGSTQSTGLPAGYRATVRTFGNAASSGSLQSFCTPGIEKGTESSACTLLLSCTSVVLQQTIDPVAATPQTFLTLRLLRPRAGVDVQIADLTPSRRDGATRARLTAAQAWVRDQVPNLTRVRAAQHAHQVTIDTRPRTGGAPSVR